MALRHALGTLGQALAIADAALGEQNTTPPDPSCEMCMGQGVIPFESDDPEAPEFEPCPNGCVASGPQGEGNTDEC